MNLQVLRRGLTVLLAQGSMSIGAFVFFAVAARATPAADYARLVETNSGALLLAAVFDVGLSIGTLAFYLRSQSASVLTLDVLHRWSIGGLAVLAASVLLALGHLPAAGLIGAAAFLAIMNGARPLFQAGDSLRQYTVYSVMGLALRCLVTLALLLGAPIAVSLVLFYLAPALLLLPYYRGLRLAPPGPWSEYRALLGYSAPILVSALSFMCVPLIPVAVFSRVHGVEEVGAYGVVLTCLAPLGLVIVAVRSALLPVIIAGERLFSPAKTTLVAVCATGGLLLATAGGYLAVRWLFPNHPSAGGFFALFFPLYGATALIGLLNTRVHAVRATTAEAVVNVARLLGATVASFALAERADAVLLSCGLFLLIGEIALAVYLQRTRR